MKLFVIAAFYKFVALPDYEAMKEPLLALMREKEIKGTLILAHEGINGTFAGLADSVDYLIETLRRYPGMNELRFNKTLDDRNPFKKAKVKLRKEIVTLGQQTVNPEDITGKHLSPQEWNQLIADPEVVLVDTRNDYEIELGTFKGAINPKTENFRDFPTFVETQLLDKKNKKIAMFCTGGIRCEKSTSYLKQLGFDKVYQLHGGILNYLETIPSTESQWRGECFVFDERVALNHELKSLPEGSIDTEWKNNFKKKTDL